MGMWPAVIAFKGRGKCPYKRTVEDGLSECRKGIIKAAAVLCLLYADYSAVTCGWMGVARMLKRCNEQMIPAASPANNQCDHIIR